MNLETINETLALAEQSLRDREATIHSLRGELHVARTSAPLPNNSNNSSNNNLSTSTATRWSKVSNAMHQRVAVNKKNKKKNNNANDDDDDEDDDLLQEQSCVVDTVLLQTLALAEWFDECVVPRMHKWHTQLNQLDGRLRRLQQGIFSTSSSSNSNISSSTIQPRLRQFCRDLRRRKRVADVCSAHRGGGGGQQQQDDDDQNARALEAENRRLANQQNQVNQRRRKALAELNVFLARVPATMMNK